MASPLRVEIVIRPGLPWRDAAGSRSFLRRIARDLGGVEGVVSVLICGDEEMAGLNGRHLGKSGPTDVLSFPAGAPPPGAEGLAPVKSIGDIAISADTAARQAGRARRTLEAEVLTLLAHGFLHLLGYDHESDDGEMLALQRGLCRRHIPRLTGVKDPGAGRRHR